MANRMSKGEAALLFGLAADGHPTPKAEYRFHDVRRWRFDYCWPQWKIAIEIEGLTPKIGRHQRMRGYELDCIKYNHAAIEGWIVLRFSTRQCLKQTQDCLDMIYEAMEVRGDIQDGKSETTETEKSGNGEGVEPNST